MPRPPVRRRRKTTQQRRVLMSPGRRRPRFESLEQRVLLAATPWQHPVRPLDVTNDGQATPYDALLLINRLNRPPGPTQLPERTDRLAPYYDVSGDGFLTPYDALQVINGLNRFGADAFYDTARAEGASEAAPAGFVSMVFGALPGYPSEQVALTTEQTVGAEAFNELGFFVVDDASGSVNGIAPEDPAYPEAVFASPERQVLYSHRDIFQTDSLATFRGGQTLGVYVLQETTGNGIGDPAAHMRVLENGAQSRSIDWEQHVPDTPNRMWDADVTIEVHIGEPFSGNAPPRISAIADRTIDELTPLRIVLPVSDPDNTNDELRYSFSAPPGVYIDSNGVLDWTPADVQGPKTHQVTVRASDPSGAYATESFLINVLEVNSPTQLHFIADRLAVVGTAIEFTATASDTDNPANELTFSLAPGSPAGAWINPATGAFSWTPASEQTVEITVRVTDNGLPAMTAAQTFTVQAHADDCAFDDNLSAWEFSESGGSAAGHGTVVAAGCAITVTEGDSFVVGLQHSFTIPSDAVALQFTFDDLRFDTTDHDSINDAFEVALLDRQGNSLVATHASGRDAFFNITDGLDVAAAPGIQVDGNTVTVGLGGILVGTEAELIFRLANNDEDTTTDVRIGPVRFVDRVLAAEPPSIDESEFYRYADWQQAEPNSGTASGSISMPDGSPLSVRFLAEAEDGSAGSFLHASLMGGPNYWVPSATYKGRGIPNAPADPDMVALVGGVDHKYKIVFSPPVRDPIMAIFSLGSPWRTASYEFDAPFTIESRGHGYWGGTLTSLTQSGNTLTGTEGNGTIQFHGTFSELSWTVPVPESWHGFTVGIPPDALEPEPSIDFSRLADVAGSVSGVYLRTSFNDAAKLLYIDLATHNDGMFSVNVPLLVGIKNISNPNVSLVDPDGVMPDGTPYYDYSEHITAGKLEPGQVSAALTIRFHNPLRQQFEYELVFLGQLSES